MSACALSLEGKNLWILKTMPLGEREVLISKTLPQIIVTAPPTFLCSIMLITASSAPIEYWVFFILTPVIANVFSAIFGTVINVAFPKFEYENEAQPIKQSLSVFIVMVAQMLFYAAVAIVVFILSFVLHPLIVCAALLALFLALAILLYVLLVGPVTRKYATFEV